MTSTITALPAAAGDAAPTDRQWTYTPADGLCRVTHIPTGLEQMFGGLAEAQAWTGSGDALALLHDIAAALTVELFVLPDEAQRGVRALMVFAGTLLPAAVLPDARCDGCGGYIAVQPDGVWLHVDTCVECLDRPDEACPDDRNRHRVCRTAAAAVCGHPHCLSPALAVSACQVHELCCDCCGSLT